LKDEVFFCLSYEIDLRSEKKRKREKSRPFHFFHSVLLIVACHRARAPKSIDLGVLAQGHSLKWVRIERGATPLSSKKEGPPLPFRLRPYKVKKKSTKMSEKGLKLRKTPKVGKKKSQK
jgi:hypothetical protein